MIEGIAKISWQDPATDTWQELVLAEGVTISIGRGQDNDIYIPEQHVSRRHAIIRYEYGVFVIEDLGSANGVFVNDVQIRNPFPLVAGDVVRLYQPVLHFAAISSQQEVEEASKTGTLLRPKTTRGRAMIVITSGPQENMEIPLFQQKIVFGRATANATWDIKLQDQAVSRPHAQIELKNDHWIISDLQSANGTLLNGVAVNQPVPIYNGSVIVMGETRMLFKET
jgi:pSer/pThr/pTyr-binding forkhead associated (FHA) protein